jgi:hypothetical protein
VKTVGRELGVRYVLEGSVRRSGNHVRVTGQLIETETAAHVWADRYDGTLDDIFTLQDGNFVAAASAARRASAANPRFSVPCYLHTAALVRLGRQDEARLMATLLLERIPPRPR